MRWKYTVHVLILNWAISNQMLAQLPKTDVYMAVFVNLKTDPQFQNLTFINDFNLDGYNNQPIFISPNELFITVGQDSSKFTDLYRFNINTKEFFKFTNTNGISEFSGNVSAQKGQISCVRIELDGKDQSLWTYPEDRSHEGKRLLPNLKNVGYYCWINKNEVALFLVGSPNSLVIADITTGNSIIVSKNIGRCLKYDKKGTLYYVDKTTKDIWQLKSYQLATQKHNVICQMPSGREDYELLPNGKIICADGSKIKIIDPSIQTTWTEIVNFSSYGINNINRITVSGDKVVFVNNKL